jgi:hypothetical protein
MQATHLVHKLTPPGWQYEQAFSLYKALFNLAIHRIYEGFYQVVLDFFGVYISSYNPKTFYHQLPQTHADLQTTVH